MCDTKQPFTAALLALVILAGGLSVVFALGVTFQNALAPVNANLSALVAGQRVMESKWASGGGNTAALEARVTALENDVRALRAKVAAQPAQPPQPPAEDLSKVYDIPVGDSYVLGPKSAPVNIVAFMDYQCPYCARFYPAAREAQKTHPDQVNLVIKHFPLPFHPMARPAAKAALAAGEQGKFYEMTDALLDNAAALSPDKFKELAGKIGLDVARFTKDLQDKDAVYEKKLDADMNDLGNRVDVRGTPTYFLNGKKTNVRMPEQWKQAVEALLKK